MAKQPNTSTPSLGDFPTEDPLNPAKTANQPNTRALSWVEIIPIACTASLLRLVPEILEHASWFSTLTNLYIWTAIWFATCLSSLRFLEPHGPSIVASDACVRSVFMLRDMYRLVGDQKPGVGLEVGDLWRGGVVTLLAFGVSYYVTVEMVLLPALATEGGDEREVAEKAVADNEVAEKV